MSRPAFTKKEFDAVKANAEELYKTYGEVSCPYLQKKVSFNAKGLDHIKLKKWNKARNEKDQWMRLKLLHLAPVILRKSNTLQGIEEGNRFERIKLNNKWEEKMVYVRFYEFISVEGGCRTRIIVKQIGDLQPYFWSIVPYWKQDGSRGKKMFEGDPSSD